MNQDEALEKFIELLRTYRIGDTAWYYDNGADFWSNNPKELSEHIKSLVIDHFLLWKTNAIIEQNYTNTTPFVALVFGEAWNYSSNSTCYIEGLYKTKEEAIEHGKLAHKKWCKEYDLKQKKFEEACEKERREREDRVIKQAEEIKKRRK